jgi:N-acetylmuramoyl-L-alanine amidase
MGAAVSAFTRSLQHGSTGDEVTKLQERLTAEGVYSGPVTGYFGPLTEAAVTAYQEAKGIEKVGVVGPKTRAELNK